MESPCTPSSDSRSECKRQSYSHIPSSSVSVEATESHLSWTATPSSVLSEKEQWRKWMDRIESPCAQLPTQLHSEYNMRTGGHLFEREYQAQKRAKLYNESCQSSNEMR